MEDSTANEAIAKAKAFATDRGLRFEEPVSACTNNGNQYQVTLTVEGVSDPNAVIDPPEFVVEVDLENGAVTLIPSM